MIEPALTAGEWADPEHRVEREGSWIYEPEGSVAVVGAKDHGVSIEPVRHAIAAVALFGQSFGFTREDVAILRKEYDAVMDAQSDEFWDNVAVERARLFQSIADRIEALLPPK